MSFRFDMRNKSPQQQAIVRKNDAINKSHDEKHISSNTRKKKGIYSSNVIAKGGDYEAIEFHKSGKRILELRVSGTAIANGPCNLCIESIHDWLWETGLEFVEEIEKPMILTIVSDDVVDKKLITNWKMLKKSE